MRPDDGTAGRSEPTGQCPVCGGFLAPLEGISLKFECQKCGLELQTKGRPRPITPAVMCSIFGKSKSTLLRWEREGKIPPVARIGRSRAYGPEHFEALSEMTDVKAPEDVAMVLKATILIGQRNLGCVNNALENLGVVLSKTHYKPYTE